MTLFGGGPAWAGAGAGVTASGAGVAAGGARGVVQTLIRQAATWHAAVPAVPSEDRRGRRTAATGDADDAFAEVDGDDFAHLYRQVATPLAAYARRTLGDAEEAGDVVQEVFFRYLRAGLPAGTDPETARPYLFRSASHLMRDRWRRNARDRRWRQTRSEVKPAPAPDRDLASDLDRALGRLKPRDRALLWLAHVEGASHREIAGVLDLAEGSVRVMLFRARKRLEKVLVESDFPTEAWR